MARTDSITASATARSNPTCCNSRPLRAMRPDQVDARTLEASFEAGPQVELTVRYLDQDLLILDPPHESDGLEARPAVLSRVSAVKA